MSSGPDLYLVCKSCGAEVSPYITECPYCGTRIQKRAPKLDRGGVPKAPARERSRPQLPRLRPDEIPGIRADRRAVGRLGARARVGPRSRSGSSRTLRRLTDFTYGAGFDEPWRAFTDALRRTASPATRRSPGRDRAVRLAAREAPRLVGAAAGLPGLRRGRRVRRRRGLRRGHRRAAPTARRWACSPPGRCATCSAAATGARTTATCWACWRSPPSWCCSRWRPPRRAGIAGIVGGVIGILLGLVFARLREQLTPSTRRRHSARSDLRRARACRRAPARRPPARSRPARTGTINASANGPGMPTMSVPSLGLIAVITARKITIPSGMPTTIAISASAAPPDVTTPSTPRGVSPTAFRIAEVACPLTGHEQQGRQQVHEPDGDQQRARAVDDRAHVVAFLRTSSAGSSASTAWRFQRVDERGAVRAGREVGDHVAVAGRPARAAWRGEDHDLAVVVGLDVAADERDLERPAVGAEGDRVADLGAERVVDAAAGDRPRRDARTCARRGRRRRSARSLPRPPGPCSSTRHAPSTWKPAIVVAARRPGSRTSASACAPRSPRWTRTSHGLARSAGSSITRS